MSIIQYRVHRIKVLKVYIVHLKQKAYTEKQMYLKFLQICILCLLPGLHYDVVVNFE